MIFRRKKSTGSSSTGEPALRGRDSAGNGSNPLARRFHPEDEPDTIDLQKAARFNEEPETSDSGTKGESADYLAVITVKPETGKFYVQPGDEENDIRLGDEPVDTVTELRPGDRIRVGDMELTLLRQRHEAS